MSPEEKKLEKLNKLLEIANEDFATPDDLVKSMEAILGVITSEKERTMAFIEAKTTQNEVLNAKTLEYLNTKEKELKSLISQLGRSYSDDNEIISNKLSKEIKRLEKKIPNKVDLTEINDTIESLKVGINNFPTELTANPEAIRDGLELLQGEERLDKSAIKGLDEWYKELLSQISKSKSGNFGAGVRFLRYLSDVNIEGIANGQGIAWNTTTQRFEPVDLSGGSGSGDMLVSVYDPANGARQVAFEDDVATSLAGKANTSHTHTASQITDFGTASITATEPNVRRLIRLYSSAY